ncbi:tetratricopeptide repeat protein [Adhaeretor mobilis]|uniref:Carboxypeptidase regulatory-like domain-containing protein n=1 Tax=Adhaeretor mobilis TaxID=1930276 RepID=A0A517MZ06_9BACT|nr:tetratricopeptide repeat protein [Adhaeretor mobilis]QDT00126.1 hypothetical protein HG15A2_34610 [Adhaeretor mobilis]
MFRAQVSSSLLLLTLIGTACGTLFADQRVLLNSGTEIIATHIEIEGDRVKLQLDGESSLSLALDEIASIASVDNPHGNNAQRLLLSAFETRELTENKAGALGLLSEAYRQAPGDPRIAYWYARSLLDNSEGKAAQAILEKHRQEIEIALPALAEPLAARIAKRVKIEDLPEELVRLIDDAQSSGENMKLGRHGRMPAYAYFRLVDQDGNPMPQTEFRMSSRGSDEFLSDCGNGYYFYAYSYSPGSSQQYEHCTLRTDNYQLKQKEFQFSGSFNHAKDAGELVVSRFSDDDKLPVVVLLLDTQGRPVEGATASLRMSNSSNSAPETYRSDAKGLLKLKCFPTKLYLSVQAKGYNSQQLSLSLQNAQKGATVEREMKLYPGVTATLRLAWQTKMQQVPNQQPRVSSGESLLKIVAGKIIANQNWPHWLNVRQDKEKLLLTVVDHSAHQPHLAGQASWTRIVLPQPDEQLGDGTLVTYEDFALDELDQHKEKYPRPKQVATQQNSHGAQGSYAIRPDAIFLGELSNVMGRPGRYAFKIEVESLRLGPSNKQQ